MACFLPDTKTLFLHITRCGGTWIDRVLDRLDIEVDTWLRSKTLAPIPRKHGMSGHFVKKYMVDVDQMVVFVREPHGLYASIWKYLNRIQRKKLPFFTELSWHPFKRPAELFVEDFGDWVLAMLEQEPGFVTRLYEGYVGPAGGEFCWYVGRVETLVEDFCRLMRLLGYELEIDRHEKFLMSTGNVNASRRRPVVWPDDLWVAVSKAERPAIDRFYGAGYRRRIYAGLV